MEQVLMNIDDLIETCVALTADGKGILAADESNGTCDKRFAVLGIPQTEEMRRAYRDMLFTTPELEKSISGVILYDETIHQKTADGAHFTKVLGDAGISIGIKVDTGAKELSGHPGEKVTEGLDGLRERLQTYYDMGARFAKWRAVITIGEGLPTWGCVDANAHALARYASLCQEVGLVPIVEPEVIMDGNHDLVRCLEATEEVHHEVFAQLYSQGVVLEALILKSNMILPGLTCCIQESINEVAEATIACLLRSTPAAVAGVAFLSGGQSAELATARLNAMNYRFEGRLPWPVTFSFARALQQPAMEIWHGQADHVLIAQQALSHRAVCNQAARRGQYDASMEQV